MVNPRELAETFVRDLRAVADDRLTAATLFGSAARDEWIEGVSDVNVLVLLDRIDADLLARAGPSARSASARGVTPLLMEVGEWRRAADVFTIELADMKDASALLFGDDPIAQLPVDARILRLQAERELRAKLLHLHGAMLMAGDDRKRLGQIFVHALPSFLAYLRAAIRLAGNDVPRNSTDVIGAGKDVVGFDAAPFQRVLEARASGGQLQLGLNEPLADGFNAAAARLASFIDDFGR